jgi:tRNA pseudouridine synthase 10
MDNKKRGESIKTLLTMEGHRLISSNQRGGASLLRSIAVNGAFEIAVKTINRTTNQKTKKRCYLCHNRFESLQTLAKKTFDSLKDYEYSTFLIGIRLPIAFEEREDEFKGKFDIRYGESIRNEFSREIGKRVLNLSNKEVAYGKPEINAIINPFSEEILLQVNPLYLAGRYNKLSRGIPQTKWFCDVCGGKGCSKCDWSGEKYQESVETLIGEEILKKTEGTAAVFHAAGREDIDTLMLGRGRPFVLEIKRPRRRFIDLQDLSFTINNHSKEKIRVLELRFADKDSVRDLKKKESGKKIYRAIIEFDSNVNEEEVHLLEEALMNIIIRQRTPLRVSHRRADLVREKYIYETKIERLKPNTIEMKIQCQGGLYIKELISGDEGRTNPNITDLIGTKVLSVCLDVLNIP